jgi:hypothetical protein
MAESVVDLQGEPIVRGGMWTVCRMLAVSVHVLQSVKSVGSLTSGFTHVEGTIS